MDYGKRAEALNQIMAPRDFALRHRQLIDETLAVPSRSGVRGYSSGVATGEAEGAADVHLTNLAHEADPNSGY